MIRTPVEKHFDKIAHKYDFFTKKRELHYRSLKKLLRSLIPEGKNVLEVGCGTGDVLASLKPKVGYGFDISSQMIKLAKEKYTSKENLSFSTSWPKRSFDYIFMSDVVEHLDDPKKTFKKIAGLMDNKTIFVNTMMNPIWFPVEAVYNFFGWKMPEGPHKRRSYEDLKVLANEAGMKVVKHDYKLLMPIRIPFVTNFFNKHLEKYLKPLAFIEYFVAVKA